MSRHDESVRLRHMLEYARIGVQLARGRARSDLDSDMMFRLATTRAAEVIGEAAAHVSDAARIQYAELPWTQIVGLRNRLIHGYDQVNHDILWDVLTLDLPPLIEQLEHIVGP